MNKFFFLFFLKNFKKFKRRFKILFFIIVVGFTALPIFCKCQYVHFSQKAGDECNWFIESVSFFIYKFLYFLPYKILREITFVVSEDAIFSYTEMCGGLNMLAPIHSHKPIYQFFNFVLFWAVTFIYWGLLSSLIEWIWKSLKKKFAKRDRGIKL